MHGAERVVTMVGLEPGGEGRQIRFSFHQYATMATDSDTIIFAGSSSGIYNSIDMGESWQKKIDLCHDSESFNSLIISDSSILVLNECGLFYSKDKGAHFEKVDEPLPSPVYSLIAGDNCIFAGTTSDGLWKRPFAGIKTNINRIVDNKLKTAWFDIHIDRSPNHGISLSFTAKEDPKSLSLTTNCPSM